MADEFPKKHSEGKLLGEELRRAISGSKEANSGYVYLPSPETDYDTDRDYLTTTLMTANGEICCSMAYLDESGHQVEWSPFVSHLAQNVPALQPGDWLPTPSTTWKDLVQKEPRWINWRLFSYHQFRKPLADPTKEVTPEAISQIAEQIDPIYFKDHLNPRISRYTDPDDTITVKASEKWFTALPLERLAGPPYSTYELDIHATCPFQFYFYQFLYLRMFDNFDRRKIPYWYWKQPWVPRRLSAVYPSETTDNAIEKVISLLPSRQKDFQTLLTEKSLGEFLANNLKNPYEERRLRSSFAAERSLIRQEMSESPPRQRDWEWVQGGQEIKVENSKGSARVILPSHRLDKLRSSILILAYVGSSRWIPELLHLNDVRNNQIYDKSIKDPIADYRLAALVSHYSSSSIAGALFVGLYGEERMGYYNADLIPEHKGPRNPYPEELQMPLRTTSSAKQIFKQDAWERRVEDLRDALVERSTLMTPSTTITYKAAPDPSKCPGCVYYSLCHIPRARNM